MDLEIKRLRYLRNNLLVFFSLGFGCCRNPGHPPSTERQKPAVQMQAGYPQDIVRYGLARQYDRAKWTLYCLYGPDTCEFLPRANVSGTVTFGELDLRFNRLRRTGDTLEIYFDFYFHDTVKCDFRVLENYYYLRGAGFLHGADSVFYWISPTTMVYLRPGGSKNKYNNPLQPKVLVYIKENKARLAPWFQSEARRRGVIQ